MCLLNSLKFSVTITRRLVGIGYMRWLDRRACFTEILLPHALTFWGNRTNYIQDRVGMLGRHLQQYPRRAIRCSTPLLPVS